MQCTNHLKQYGLALQNYVDSNNGAFPYGNGLFLMQKTSAGPACAGAQIFLLPYMEQLALYDEFVTEAKSAGTAKGVYHLDVFKMANRGGPISGTTCPSDGTASESSDSGGQGSYGSIRGSYLTCWGDNMADTKIGTQSLDDFVNVPKSPYRRGVFGNCVWQKISSVVDGTSNTIAFSEGVGRDMYKLKGILVISSSLGSPETGNASSCVNKSNFSNDGVSFTGGGGLGWVDSYRAAMFGYGQARYSGFNTILPPNAISCEAGWEIVNGWGAFAPSSNHSGGVNCCRVDGSVAFISDTIDTNGSTANCVTSGKSPFGVWGALGTVNGGETVSL